MTENPGFVATRERARPLAPDERRGAILDEVLPLVRERGNDVTTRELAHAAGVAEGTLFRAFGDKDALLAAALDRLLDPERFTAELGEIPRDLPLEDKIATLIDLTRARFRDVFEIMTVFQLQRPPERIKPDDWHRIVQELLEPDASRLTAPAAAISAYIRLIAFGASIEQINVAHRLDADQLADLVTGGVTLSSPSSALE